MSVMTEARPQPPRGLHALPGRLRVHLPEWSGHEPLRVGRLLRDIHGVTQAQANPATKNALITYDPQRISQSALLARIESLQATFARLQPGAPAKPHASVHHHEGATRARITVRGINRDPQVAQRVVEQLQSHAGVHARASALTGRVLIEFSAGVANLDDLIQEVANVELPEEPGEDRPRDPLDPLPLIQSVARTIGATLGLALFGLQQLPGLEGPLIDPQIPATVSGVLSILRGFPFIRNGLRRLLGRDAADLAFSLPNIAALALTGSPTGLAVSGAESLRLLTEVSARQSAWKRYEERLAGAVDPTPGAIIRLASGDRAPRAAHVIEGTGVAIDRAGTPQPIAPGAEISAGARLNGGPFVVELQTESGFALEQRPAPLRPTLYDKYVRWLSPLSLGYAALTAAVTRSPGRTFAALLLVNPRTAVIGMEAANLDTSARVLRAGATIVGVRANRTIRRPDTLIIDGPRLLTDQLEVTSVFALEADMEGADLLNYAGAIASATGYPWGGALRMAGSVTATDGHFDGKAARARIGDETYTLGAITNWHEAPPAARRLRQRGDSALELRRGGRPLGVIGLRPRRAPGVAELVAACQRANTELILLPGGDELAARNVARRAHVALVDADTAIPAIRSRQARGDYVAYLSDGAHAAAAFEACDLAIGLTEGRTPFAAAADLLVSDLGAVAAIVDAGVRREQAVRDSVLLSIAANVFGAIWGFRGRPGIERASQGVYVTALAALADGLLRLRGGERKQSLLAILADPQPERWGGRSVAETLAALKTTEQGLTSAEAARRQHNTPAIFRRRTLAMALLEQLRSPLALILSVGAGISLVLGAPADVAIIGATLAATALVGAWQEYKANQVSYALERLSAANARVLRDGQATTLPTHALVPGDVLLLGAGDRVTADARLITNASIELDEAALTGESLPTLKSADGPTDTSRIVLDGSDVITGGGRAVVVAVGRETRLGTITAALSADERKESPLNRRLSRLLGQVIPLALGGGALVIVSGFLRTGQLLSQLAIGATIALAAVPEGLPLLTEVSEASVASRLALRHAVTRRLPAVESLGRVDVLCADKTGTLTQGKLTVSLLADLDGEQRMDGGPLPSRLRSILLAAALASPHPTSPEASAHPTDVAIITAADHAELSEAIRQPRAEELAFDPARGFHSSRAQGRVYVKGAPEVIAPRCVSMRVGDGKETRPLDSDQRARLLARAHSFAARGLRTLMVAEGPGDTALDDPQGLTALGYVGISDPLKPKAQATVRRCREAGVRVIMLTGDHPSTARAIASEAGLLDDPAHDDILTGAEIAELHNGDLDQRVERAAVIARATPLDKVRIVESLQRQGHIVAMTGDGVNDAPALRLANVGVAIGRGATEVARQTADVVIADDDFSTLVETFVEGRNFWWTIRRAIALLLGGNLGELGLVVGATSLGFMSPLTARQALIVNIITDVLPGLAVALNPPKTRNLAALAREGASALDRPLWNDVIRRGVFTGAPSLLGFLLALRSGGLPQARAVAFASVIGTQLAQTIDLGWSEGNLTPAIVGSVAGSAAMLGLSLAVPSLRAFLGLAIPSPFGWALIGGAAGVAFLLSRASWRTSTAPAGVLRPALALPAPTTAGAPTAD